MNGLDFRRETQVAAGDPLFPLGQAEEGEVEVGVVHYGPSIVGGAGR